MVEKRMTQIQIIGANPYLLARLEPGQNIIYWDWDHQERFSTKKALWQHCFARHIKPYGNIQGEMMTCAKELGVGFFKIESYREKSLPPKWRPYEMHAWFYGDVHRVKTVAEHFIAQIQSKYSGYEAVDVDYSAVYNSMNTLHTLLNNPPHIYHHPRYDVLQDGTLLTITREA